MKDHSATIICRLFLFLLILASGCATRTYQPVIIQHSFAVEQIERLNLDTAAVFRSVDVDVEKALKDYNKKHK